MAKTDTPSPSGCLTFYTESEIEEITGGKLGRRRLQQLRQRGGGPDFFKDGRRVLYPEDRLLAWINSQVRKSTSDTSSRAA